MNDDGFQYSENLLSDGEKLMEYIGYIRGCARFLQHRQDHLSRYLEFLVDEMEGNPRAEDFLKKSMESMDGISSMTEAILADAFGESALESVALKPMVEGVVDRCKRLFEKMPAPIILCPEDAIATVNVFQFQQVLFETFSNAFKRMENQETISIRVDDITLEAIQIQRMSSSIKPGNYTLIEIIGGADVPSEYISYVEASCNQSAGNCSVQIARSIGILDIHGGDLLVKRNATAVGFRILIPKAEQPKETFEPAGIPADALTAGGTETILLVDDEDMIWDVVTDILMRLGYTVILAGNGKEAVETYRANLGMIDLVIMDMVMPEMNGREAFEALRQIDPGAKVLMSSGYVSEEDAKYVLSRGAVGFLRKPYRLSALASVIREILDGKN